MDALKVITTVGQVDAQNIFIFKSIERQGPHRNGESQTQTTIG